MLRREQIKDRMLKTAARIWDVPEAQIESNFDPLVVLLLEACAAEYEQLESKLQATQDRLLDKLAEHILPNVIMHSQPASSIVKTSPTENNTTIDEKISFNINQKIQQVGKPAYSKEFFFTPIGQFNLLKAELSYMCTPGSAYKCLSNGSKEVLQSQQKSGNGYVNTLWLTFQLDASVKSLKGLQLYFDLKGHSEAQHFYESLQCCKTFYNNAEIVCTGGFYNQEQFELNLNDALSNGLSYNRKIQKKIAGIYENRFLHFPEHFDINPQPIPADLLEILPEKAIQEINSSTTITLKLELGRMFQQDTLDRLICVSNAFPVINRTLQTLHYKTDPLVNIVPVATNDIFLDLAEITTAGNAPYKINISADTRQMSEGEAMIRSSGIGKTSSNDIRQIISNLADAIRDESAYFTRINNDFVLSRLKEITRILTRLEDQVSLAENKKETINYLLIRPKAAGESLSVKYWTTAGAEAHYIKAGSALNAHNHSLVHNKNTFLLTNCSGGKSNVSDAEKQWMLKQELHSGGKIISAEDIKLLCFRIFGNKLKNISISKNISAAPTTTEGFQRSIDILLQLNHEAAETNIDEVNYLCAELQYYLTQNASPIYPFKIKLK